MENNLLNKLETKNRPPKISVPTHESYSLETLELAMDLGDRSRLQYPQNTHFHLFR